VNIPARGSGHLKATERDLVRSKTIVTRRTASISYLTSTSATAAPLLTVHGAHRLHVLGFHRGERAVYLREEIGAAPPVAYVVRTRGEHAGKMVAVRGLDDRAAELTRMDALDPDLWSLHTRVVQRRALKMPNGGRPIRKFAVQLTVEPVTASPDTLRGRTVVTSYLRPRAHLDGVWCIPGEPLALARVTYVGVPEGIGLDKQVALLVGRIVH
jgi:hypothetical protein